MSLAIAQLAATLAPPINNNTANNRRDNNFTSPQTSPLGPHTSTTITPVDTLVRNIPSLGTAPHHCPSPSLDRTAPRHTPFTSVITLHRSRSLLPTTLPSTLFATLPAARSALTPRTITPITPTPCAISTTHNTITDVVRTNRHETPPLRRAFASTLVVCTLSHIPVRFAAISLALTLFTSGTHAQPAPAYTSRSWGSPIPVDGVRPPTTATLRSLRAPVDVHLGPNVDPALAPLALDLAERTLDELQFTLRWPLPLPDGTHGGSPAFDLYLTSDGPSSLTLTDTLCPDTLWTRATAFARVHATTDRLALHSAIAQAIAHATIIGQNAEISPAAVAAMALSLSRSLTHFSPDPDTLRAWQHSPSLALASGTDTSRSHGDSLFFDWLSLRWDDPYRSLLHGLVVGPAQRTADDSSTFWGEPDFFDLAARVFRDEPGGLASVLLGFAKTRAALGSNTSLLPYPDRTLSAQPTQTLRWSQLPAWTVSSHPLEPAGLGLVAIDLNDAPPQGNPTLAVWVHTPTEQQFLASVIRLDPAGNPVSAIDSQPISNGSWSAQVESLENIARVLVVVTSLGDHRPDPEAPVPLRAWWTITVSQGSTETTPTRSL